MWIKNQYGNPPLYITENGVSDKNGTLIDQHRIDFYSGYINNVLKGTYLYNCAETMRHENVYESLIRYVQPLGAFLCRRQHEEMHT